MGRSTPVTKPHTSTADLLTWSETSPPDSARPGSGSSRPNARPHQPSDGISKVVFGGQVTDEEAESLNKRKPCSGYKIKEITGRGIFSGSEENDPSESGNTSTTNNRTEIRMYQVKIRRQIKCPARASTYGTHTMWKLCIGFSFFRIQWARHVAQRRKCLIRQIRLSRWNKG